MKQISHFYIHNKYIINNNGLAINNYNTFLYNHNYHDYVSGRTIDY